MSLPILASGQVQAKLVYDTGTAQKQLDSLGKSAAAKAANIYRQSTPHFNAGPVLKDMSRFEQSLGRISSKANEFNKSLDASTARIIAFGATMKIMNTVTAAFGNLFIQAREVEKQMAVLNTVYETSQSRLNDIKRELFDIARGTGTTFAAVTESAVEFARQGLAVSETLKRTKDSMVLMRITGLDSAKSVTAITAALNTFNGLANDSSKFINKLAAVDQAYAVSSKDLAEAISRVGSTAQDAGVSFEQLLGLVTAAQAKTARGGAVIGNAFKSIFTRVNRSDTIDELKSLGVAIDSSQSGIQKLYALSDAIKSVGDPTVAAKIKELAGGVYQVNIVAAALQDLGSTNSITQKAASTALNASDEAYRKAAILTQTLNDKILNLTTSWNQFSAAVGDSVIMPVFKELVDILQSVVTKMNGLAKENPGLVELGKTVAQGLLKPLLVISGLAIAKLFGEFVVFATKAAAQVVTMGTESKKIEASQQMIIKHLATDKALREAMLNTNTTMVEKERIMLQYMQEEIAALTKINQLSGSLARGVAKQGIFVSDKGGFEQESRHKTVARNVKNRFLGRFADGYMPAIQKEQQAINQGVGNARGAKPVVVKNVRLQPGGPKQDIVANSKEWIVPNYAGSGAAAIFNPEMARNMGLPSGAKKVGSFAGGLFRGYHGTNAKFSEFNRDYIRPSEFGGMGFHFASDKTLSERYGRRLIEAELKLDNPYQFSSIENYRKRFQVPTLGSIDDVRKNTSLSDIRDLKDEWRYYSTFTKEPLSFDKWLYKLKYEEAQIEGTRNLLKSGFDSTIYKIKGNDAYTVYNPNQIKILSGASGHIPNYANGIQYKKLFSNKSLKTYVTDAESNLSFSLNKDKSKINIDYINSQQKGDAFSMFGRLGKTAKRINKPIYSSVLEKQNLSDDILSDTSLRNSDLLLKMYPQLRYRDTSNFSSSFDMRVGASGMTRTNLEAAKSMVDSMPRDKFLRMRNRIFIGGVETKALAGGSVPNYAVGSKYLTKREQEVLKELNAKRQGKKTRVDNILKQLKIAEAKRYEENPNIGARTLTDKELAIKRSVQERRDRLEYMRMKTKKVIPSQMLLPQVPYPPEPVTRNPFAPVSSSTTNPIRSVPFVRNPSSIGYPPTPPIPPKTSRRKMVKDFGMSLVNSIIGGNEQTPEEKKALRQQRWGQFQMGLMFGGPMLASLLDSGNKGGTNVGFGMASGALNMAAMGSLFGPYGAIAGGVLGGVSGMRSGMKAKAFQGQFGTSINQANSKDLTTSINDQRAALESNIAPLSKIQEAFADISDEQVESAKNYATATLKLTEHEKSLISSAKTAKDFGEAINKVGENINSSAKALDEYQKFLEAVKSVSAEGDTQKMAQLIGSFGGGLVGTALNKVSAKDAGGILAGGLNEDAVRKLLIKSGVESSFAGKQAAALNLGDAESAAAVADEVAKVLGAKLKDTNVELILKQASDGFNLAAEKMRMASFNFLASSEAMKATSAVLRGRNEGDAARLLSKSIYGEVLADSPFQGERRGFEADIRRTEIENELKTEERGILQDTLSVLQEVKHNSQKSNIEDLLKNVLGGRLNEYISSKMEERTVGLENVSEATKTGITGSILDELKYNIGLGLGSGKSNIDAIKGALGDQFFTPDIANIIKDRDFSKQIKIDSAISKFVENAQGGSFNDQTQQSLEEVIKVLQSDKNISAAGQAEAIQQLIELNSNLIEFKNKPFIESIKELGRMYNQGLKDLGQQRTVPKLSDTFMGGLGAAGGFGVGVKKSDFDRAGAVDAAIRNIRKDETLPDEVKSAQIEAIRRKAREKRGGAAARFDRQESSRKLLEQTLPLIFSSSEVGFNRERTVRANKKEEDYITRSRLKNRFEKSIAGRRTIDVDRLTGLESSLGKSEAGKSILDEIRSKQRDIFSNLLTSGLTKIGKDNPLLQPEAKISDVASYFGKILPTLKPGRGPGGEEQFNELLNQINELFALLKKGEETQQQRAGTEEQVNKLEESLTPILPENIRKEFSNVSDWTGGDVSNVNRRFNDEIMRREIERVNTQDPNRRTQLTSEISGLQEKMRVFNSGMQKVVGFRGGKIEGAPDVAKLVTVDFQQKITADGKIEVSITDANEAAKKVLEEAQSKISAAIADNTRIAEENKRDLEAKIAELAKLVKNINPPVRQNSTTVPGNPNSDGF